MTILARFGLSRSRGAKSDQVGLTAQPPSNPLVVGSLGSLCSDNLSIIKLIFLHKLLHPSFHILQVDVGYPAKLYTQIMLTSELSPTAHIASITAKGHQRANAIGAYYAVSKAAFVIYWFAPSRLMFDLCWNTTV